MGRGKALNVAEQARVEILAQEGYSCRQIARKISRSKNVVHNYLRNKENYGKNMKGRTALATSPRDRRAILREASNSASTTAKIKAKTGVHASLDTIRRVIKTAGYIKRKKLKKKPPLDAKRKKKRLDFAKQHMTWNQQWGNVVFTDEKKFNMDGPDGFQYYFHDLRKEERVLSRNHSRQGGVMVWGGITSLGVLKLSFQSAKMNSDRYIQILESALPEAEQLFGGLSFVYQQDNAPIHTAKKVKQWFSSKNVEILSWPPYSPDLNIMENLWGLVSRKVYEGGKQYDQKTHLINAISEAWHGISDSILASLYASMQNRIFEVISKNGGNTHY